MKKKVWMLWFVSIVAFTCLIWGPAVAAAAGEEVGDDYKLNMQWGLEKADKPVTMFVEYSVSKDDSKVGLRYRFFPHWYGACHIRLTGANNPLDVEGVYRVPSGLDYVNLYGGVGVDLSDADLFNGYLIGGLEIPLVFAELNYYTHDNEISFRGGLRIPVF